MCTGATDKCRLCAPVHAEAPRRPLPVARKFSAQSFKAASVATQNVSKSCSGKRKRFPLWRKPDTIAQQDSITTDVSPRTARSRGIVPQDLTHELPDRKDIAIKASATGRDKHAPCSIPTPKLKGLTCSMMKRRRYRRQKHSDTGRLIVAVDDRK